MRIGEWDTSTDEDCSPDDQSFCAPPPVDHFIVQAITHKKYRVNARDQQFDIALLRLAKTVTFNDFVRPVCLPLNPELWDKDYTNHTFDVAGTKLTADHRDRNINNFFIFFRLG